MDSDDALTTQRGGRPAWDVFVEIGAEMDGCWLLYSSDSTGKSVGAATNSAAVKPSGNAQIVKEKPVDSVRPSIPAADAGKFVEELLDRASALLLSKILEDSIKQHGVQLGAEVANNIKKCIGEDLKNLATIFKNTTYTEGFHAESVQETKSMKNDKKKKQKKEVQVSITKKHEEMVQFIQKLVFGSTPSDNLTVEERNGIGLTEHLTDIFVGENDGDLLIQQSGREDRILQCVSNGNAEDRLLDHLSQHFEPMEVGMLARCFCIPLVSIRVGKINKQGNHFQPTALRGNLSLALLPSLDLLLSFVGDDGQTERLFTLSDKHQCPAISINEIPADSSGRSFLVKVPDGKGFYYWCSEKSKLLRYELVSKMKDLIKRKPSIAELSGINELRLGYFVTPLRAFLLGTTVKVQAHSGLPSPSTACDAIDEHYGNLVKEGEEERNEGYESSKGHVNPSGGALLIQSIVNRAIGNVNPFGGALLIPSVVNRAIGNFNPSGGVLLI
ncbi:RNI-like superfamily protein [Hibiscus syriacus]|uniref:RNI-like superfamily protein n=1 Tax=Hibiscus syriacus TaxID=106335 RepID=A0A6A2WLX9_HIBSY|nr:RNI-like superfamily protein [Hibiscus syriacus]